MSRLIRHDATSPAILEVDGKFIEICQCGLSKNKPFCDDSHKITRSEESGKTYVYGPNGDRVEVTDMFPHPTKRFKPEP